MEQAQKDAAIASARSLADKVSSLITDVAVHAADHGQSEEASEIRRHLKNSHGQLLLEWQRINKVAVAQPAAAQPAPAPAAQPAAQPAPAASAPPASPEPTGTEGSTFE